MLLLSPEERGRGVIAASAGNHGRAVAYHARRLGIAATIVMPENSPLIKVQNCRAAGARVILHGASFDEATERACAVCAHEGTVYLHAFDDPAVIAGQGTCALEILEQFPEVECAVVPVGGGGLIAGMAVALKAARPSVRIIGVQCEGVPGMAAALAQGGPVTVAPQRTIADGIAVRHVGAATHAIVAGLVDEVVTVNEAEIANAILLMLESEKTVVEGAGAVGVAALHNGRVRAEGRHVAVVLSGGNIDENILSRVIDRGLVKDGRQAKLRVIVPDHPGQLSRILDSVAAARANILDISHSRAFSPAQVGETLIDIVVETRGPEHIADIQGKLLEQGIRAERVF